MFTPTIDVHTANFASLGPSHTPIYHNLFWIYNNLLFKQCFFPSSIPIFRLDHGLDHHWNSDSHADCLDFCDFSIKFSLVESPTFSFFISVMSNHGRHAFRCVARRSSPGVLGATRRVHHTGTGHCHWIYSDGIQVGPGVSIC